LLGSGWWSLQPFVASLRRDRFPAESQPQKKQIVYDGTDAAYNLAIKHKAKVGWGTDILFSPRGDSREQAKGDHERRANP
jgi:hypothetical protein